ncbi:MAG TPA: CPBP family intramembrane glutamic endopeptidase [Candidatus Acidoferrum sp.]|nr:CPBP family intramembrane glutamic endopeptidase [Candidatus Acidoferrum sp.]
MGPDAPGGALFPEPRREKPPQHLLTRLFLSERGLRAGWRLLLYAALALLLNFSFDLLGSLFLDFSRGFTSPPMLSFEEISGFASVYLAALLMARLEHRPAGEYGLPLPRAFSSRFWIGAFLGLCEISLLMGSIALCGGYSFGSLMLRGPLLVGWACFWMVLFIFVGLYEEFLFRGYTQFTLAEGIGFWPAAILLSLFFGAVHSWNPGEDWRGMAEIVVTGLVFAFALKRTGNLWLAVGWHASFDFGETFLYSVPDSGALFPGHLSNASLHGPVWLTGGAVGPEASVFAFFTMGLSVLVIHLLYPAQKSST